MYMYIGTPCMYMYMMYMYSCVRVHVHVYIHDKICHWASSCELISQPVYRPSLPTASCPLLSYNNIIAQLYHHLSVPVLVTFNVKCRVLTLTTAHVFCD